MGGGDVGNVVCYGRTSDDSPSRCQKPEAGTEENVSNGRVGLKLFKIPGEDGQR